MAKNAIPMQNHIPNIERQIVIANSVLLFSFITSLVKNLIQKSDIC